MAGFEVIIYGRFWVIAEERPRRSGGLDHGCNVSPGAIGMLEDAVSAILTLRFDPASQAHFEGMRQRYFPPERNLVPAHLTLFHVLPISDEICTTLARTAAATRVFSLAVTGLRTLGRGVAYTLDGPELDSLHRVLAFSFATLLSPQDQQKFRPHVVIQNKSTAESAKVLLALLQSGFQRFMVEAHGLDLWHYRNGPWELARAFDFVG